MRVYISSDIEGAAGIVDWGQVIPGRPEFEIGRRLLLGEVNAAIEGAIDAGATHVLVNDSHHSMQNMPPGELAGGAAYLSGRHKPLYMMEGLDGGFDAVFMVAYHGSIGAERAALSHTYNPRAVYEVRLNGTPVGESALNALVALHHGVPVALVTGDEVTAEEGRRFSPSVEAVVVKRSVTRLAAESLHPDRARELIRAGARRALERAAEIGPPRIDLPATIEVDLLTADMAELATAVRGVERVRPRTVAIEGDHPLDLFQAFVGMVAITRMLVED